MSVEQIVNITLIGANVLTVLVGMIAGGRLIWNLSKLDSKATDAKSAAVRAHKRIDDLEKYVRIHPKNGSKD